MEYACIANIFLIDSYRKLNGLNRHFNLKAEDTPRVLAQLDSFLSFVSKAGRTVVKQ
jgi:hypothetical protein